LYPRINQDNFSLKELSFREQASPQGNHPQGTTRDPTDFLSVSRQWPQTQPSVQTELLVIPAFISGHPAKPAGSCWLLWNHLDFCQFAAKPIEQSLLSAETKQGQE